MRRGTQMSASSPPRSCSREASIRVSYYRDRPALVLGGLGFIGTHVTERLRGLGAHVTVATRSLAHHREAAAAFESRGVKCVGADLGDRDAMLAAVKGQDVIFNLAGQSGAVRSMEDPWTDLDVNCRGNLVLLEAVRLESPDAKLVFASSRLTYGHGAGEPTLEEQVPDPLCIHAVHKLAVEQYMRLYGRLYGLRFSVARLTNPYGAGQPTGRTAYGVVNRMIHQALAGETLPIFGDGHQLRDYIYIDDAVGALLRLGETRESDGRLYNVGSGVGTPLVQMARSIVRLAGSGHLALVPWPKLAGQIETGDFVADIARIRREVGWEPRTPLADGLERTVALCRSELSTAKPDQS
jgi:UDP-glucose 4-epimerase